MSGGLSIVMDAQKPKHLGNNLKATVYVHRASFERQDTRKEEEKQNEN